MPLEPMKSDIMLLQSYFCGKGKFILGSVWIYRFLSFKIFGFLFRQKWKKKTTLHLRDTFGMEWLLICAIFINI